MSIFKLAIGAFVAACLLWGRDVAAQLPNPALDFIYPAGGQVGHSVTVQVGGRDLDEGRELVFSHPGLVGVQGTRDPGEFEQGPQPIPNQFVITIPVNMPPGRYDVRVLGRFGLSTPRTFVVSELTEQTDPGGNHRPDAATPLELDTVVNGRTDGGVVDHYRFSADAGQRIVVECLAQQIDADLLPVLTIWSADGQQLKRSRQLEEPLLVFEAPAQGEYILGVHDHLYRGGAAQAYRICLRTGPYVVTTDPILAEPETQQSVTLIGVNLPGAATDSPYELADIPLKQSQVSIFAPDRTELAGTPIVAPATAAPQGFVLRVPGPGDSRSNGVFLGFADHPVTRESDSNDRPRSAQTVAVPCDIAGRFYPRRDQDWYEFPAQKGQQFQIRVLSHRWGHPTDPEIFVQRVIRNDNGDENVSQVSTEDDRGEDNNRFRQGIRRGLELAHRDPIVTFTADQDASYRVGLRDLNGGSIDDPRFAYRLTIEPLDPDFRLLAWTQQQAANDDKRIDRASLVIRPLETEILLIDAIRQGNLDAPIQLEVDGLPAGITAAADPLTAGATTGMITLTAAADAQPWHGAIRVIGTCETATGTIRREAVEAVLTNATGNVEQSRPAARLARQLTLSVSGDHPPVALVPADEAGGVYTMALGGKISIPFKYVKQSEIKSDLALSLFGTPDKVKVNAPAVKADAENALVELNFEDAGIAPGTYPMLLRGKVKVSYARNPEAISRAESDRQQFNDVLSELTSQVQQAAERLATLQSQRDAAQAQVAKLSEAQSTIRTAFQAASQQIAQATEQLSALQKETNSNEGDAAAQIQKLVSDTAKSAQDIQTQVQSAQQSLAQLEEKIAALNQQAQSSQQMAEEVQSQHQSLIERQQRAQEYVKQLDSRVEEAKKNLGPKDLELFAVTPAFSLRIVPTPIEVKCQSPSIQLNAGESKEVEIDVARQFGFADTATIETAVPAEAKGLTVETVTVPKEQSRGSITITAAEDSEPGEFTAQVKVKVKFNGVDSESTLPIQVTIVRP